MKKLLFLSIFGLFTLVSPGLYAADAAEQQRNALMAEIKELNNQKDALAGDAAALTKVASSVKAIMVQGKHSDITVQDTAHIELALAETLRKRGTFEALAEGTAAVISYVPRKLGRGADTVISGSWYVVSGTLLLALYVGNTLLVAPGKRLAGRFDRAFTNVATAVMYLVLIALVIDVLYCHEMLPNYTFIARPIDGFNNLGLSCLNKTSNAGHYLYDRGAVQLGAWKDSTLEFATDIHAASPRLQQLGNYTLDCVNDAFNAAKLYVSGDSSQLASLQEFFKEKDVTVYYKGQLVKVNEENIGQMLCGLAKNFSLIDGNGALGNFTHVCQEAFNITVGAKKPGMTDVLFGSAHGT